MPTCTPMKVEARPTHAISMPQNKSGCIPPRGREIVLDTSNARSREAREATEQPEEYDDLLDSPRIGLKFSGAKTKYGVVMGWAPDCDMILPKKGISRYHAALSFDKANHLVVRECLNHSNISTT